MNFEHLTDEQFAGLLAGDHGDACARQHVESCAACQRELASVGGAVSTLSRLSMRWAERHAAHVQTPSNWALSWSALPGWGATVAGVLIFGVALGAHMQTSDQTAALAPQHTITAPTDDELAQDNRLMRSIDNEINEQPGAQVTVTDLDDSSRSGRHHGLREVSN